MGIGRTLRKLALALAVLLAPLVAAQAAAGNDRGFTGEVPGVAGKSWIDLLSQIFPDIAASDGGGATASDINDLRSIGPGDDARVKCVDNIRLSDRDAKPIHLAGGGYVVVTVTIEDECVGLIALFDGAGKLVDAVNIRGDVHVSFSDDYVRPLGTEGALVIATLWHDNSSQSYDRTALVLARVGGLSAIGNMRAFGERMCGENGKPGQLLNEESKVKVTPNGDPFARIEVTVTRSLQNLAAKDCETARGPVAKTNFTGSWRWNTQKNTYEAHTPALDSLSKWNEKHF